MCLGIIDLSSHSLYHNTTFIHPGYYSGAILIQRGQEMKPINKPFYGWFIAAAGFIILFSLHGVIINTFGVFLKPVSEDMGWSRVGMPVALGIGAIAMAIGSPFVGKFLDTLGARRTMITGCLLCGGGMALIGGTTESWQIYVLFAVVGLGLAAATSVPVSLLIANWFNQKRGIAMGTAFMGTSLGGMIMNPVNTALLHSYGWRKSYIILGIAMTLVTLPVVLLIIRTRPSEMNLSPDGVEPTEREIEVLPGQSLQEALRTYAFWFIAANMFLTNFMANAIGVHCVPFLTDPDMGHSDMVAAVGYGLSLGFMTLGKVGLGWQADRMGARLTFVLSAIMTSIGIGILMLASPLWVVILFAFVYGYPQGGPLTLTPMVAVDCHGLRNFGTIFGLQTFFSIFGAAVGPIVVGIMRDRSGSYQSGFILLIIVTLISSVCIYMARPSD
jgi:MFS family permease